MKTERLIDHELDALRDRLLRLGGETEAALQLATVALVARDSAAAREVIAKDDEIDQQEVELDRRCIDTLALRQPVACDLRFVISVTRIAPLLGQIADHACGIASAALELNEESRLSAHIKNIPRMAEIAAEMLRAALRAFVSSDAEAARACIARGTEMDKLYRDASETLTRMMVSAPATTTRAVRLLMVAKYLERIGDYVTQIGEITIYLAEAAIVKRRSARRMAIHPQLRGEQAIWLLN